MIKKAMGIAMILTVLGQSLWAQTRYAISTIERKPFSFKEDGEWTGFSIELWELIAAALDGQSSYIEHDVFGEMLQSSMEGRVDLAAANISVTAEREELMDFTQPIFDGGLTIMTRAGESNSIWSAILNPQLFMPT